MIKLAGRFEGIRIFESKHFGTGFNSAGLCLPGIGIFIGEGTYEKDPFLVMHEYGHILQYQEVGFIFFYLKIGLRSLWSAKTNGYGKGHQNYWTERWANYLSDNYFTNQNWPYNRFPTSDISNSKHKSLKSWWSW